MHSDDNISISMTLSEEVKCTRSCWGGILYRLCFRGKYHMGQTLDGVKFLGNGLYFVSCRKSNLEKLVIIFFFNFHFFAFLFWVANRSLRKKLNLNDVIDSYMIHNSNTFIGSCKNYTLLSDQIFKRHCLN